MPETPSVYYVFMRQLGDKGEEKQIQQPETTTAVLVFKDRSNE